MIFFDTNLLVYAVINQDSDKQKQAEELIETAIAKGQLVVSPLVLSELVFVLAKIDDLSSHMGLLQYFERFCTPAIEKADVVRAAEIANARGCGKSINDLVHLIHAESQGCERLFTFDKGFHRFQGETGVKILVL